MKIVYQQYVGKFHNPKNSRLAKIFILKSMFKLPYLYQYVTNSSKRALKILVRLWLHIIKIKFYLDIIDLQYQFQVTLDLTWF